MVIPEIQELMVQALDMCAKRFNIPTEAITGPSRRFDYIVPRHALMYAFAVELVDKGLATLKEVGYFFGRRDHATIVNARESVWGAMEDPHGSKDILMAATARDLANWIAPKVTDIVTIASDKYPAITQAIGFIKRIEVLEKEFAIMKAQMNGAHSQSNHKES